MSKLFVYSRVGPLQAFPLVLLVSLSPALGQVGVPTQKSVDGDVGATEFTGLRAWAVFNNVKHRIMMPMAKAR